MNMSYRYTHTLTSIMHGCLNLCVISSSFKNSSDCVVKANYINIDFIHTTAGKQGTVTVEHIYSRSCIVRVHSYNEKDTELSCSVTDGLSAVIVRNQIPQVEHLCWEVGQAKQALVKLDFYATLNTWLYWFIQNVILTNFSEETCTNHTHYAYIHVYLM